MSRILLIEPDRILAETYKLALEQGGHEVVPVSSAQAAVISADQALPELVVLEIQLTEHSGIEFLYEFRSYPEWQAIPVIVQTNVPPEEFSSNRQLLRDQLGVVGYLYKPHASLRELLDHVNQALKTQS